jgi:hypothetical protein
MRRRHWLFLWLTMVSACALLNCPGGGDGPADGGDPCPNDVPASCPAQVPSYQGQVAGIIQERCFPCHATGGMAGPRFNYTTYAGVHANYGPMIFQLSICRMPPADAGQPTTDERAALLAWLVCEAPNN